MLTKTLKHKNGFTIIEIMIVLAIAGLIMLIVFLAVPALQRSAANTDRKDDAGRISSAINDFVSNNNGTLPGADGTWAADCASIMADAGNLAEFKMPSNIACGGNAAATGAVNTFDWASAAAANVKLATISPATANGDALELVTSGVCPTTASGTVTVTQGTNRQAAFLYTVDPGNTANWTWDCIQAE
jgi:prepilin-type N-terminal cleavage/methylation domain-containing protein